IRQLSESPLFYCPSSPPATVGLLPIIIDVASTRQAAAEDRRVRRCCCITPAPVRKRLPPPRADSSVAVNRHAPHDTGKNRRLRLQDAAAFVNPSEHPTPSPPPPHGSLPPPPTETSPPACHKAPRSAASRFPLRLALRHVRR